MPKNKNNKKIIRQYSEDIIQKCLKAISKGLSKRKTSIEYGIPRATIQFRLSAKFTKTTMGPAPVLGVSGEADIVNYITECSKKGFPRRKENIQACVKEYLDSSGLKNPFVNNIPGDRWYKSFFKKKPYNS